MKKHLKHLGSTLALIFGILTCFSAFAPSSELVPNVDTTISGTIIILGALAYRSAKKRRLGEVEDTETRLYTEISLIALILASIVFRNSSMLKQLIATQPAEALHTLVIIPLWVIIAYTIIASKARKTFDSKDVKQQSSDGEISDQKLVGIRGWLILPAIGIVLGFILGVIGLINALKVYSDYINAGYNITYYADLIAAVFLLGLLIYGGIIFFRKKRNAPRVIITLIVLDIIVLVILILTGLNFGPEVYAEECIKLAGWAYISAYVWIPYFIISKRVNDTFVH